MERAALQLATAGRELDAVLAEYASLKPKIARARARALQGWRTALAELPNATNGHAPDVAEPVPSARST